MKPLRLALSPLLLLLATGLTSCSTPSKLGVKHVIDTHIHLYDTTRDVEMSWPPKDDKVLYRPFLPAEYSKVAKAAGVTEVVIVEASTHLSDNDWMLDLVKGA